MRDKYWNTFYNNILKNKKLVLSVIFVTVLCFGFTITNFSIGIDDPAAMHYLHSTNGGNMIQQGRLMHVLFDKITGSVDFIPFFNDFIGAVLFALSALLFCAFFQLITKNKLHTFSLIAFATVYLSYSIITEKFIYNLDVIVTMLSYCAGAVAIAYTYLYLENKKITTFVKAVFFLMISIGSYETFIFLYICAVFAMFIIQIIVNKENLKIKDVLLQGIKCALILLISLVLYYGLVVIVQLATDQYGVFIRENILTDIKSNGLINTLIMRTKSIAYTFNPPKCLATKEFFACTIIGFIIFAALAIKKKSISLFLCYIAFFASNFGIHYIVGQVMFRAAQTFCFFIAFTLMVFVYILSSRKYARNIILIGVILLVFIQSADMNRWFYNDYARYEKEKFVIHSVADDLITKDVKKPVVFVEEGNFNYFHTNLCEDRQVNGSSMLNWSLYAFDWEKKDQIYSVFYIHGYDFIKKHSIEQIKRGNELAKEMDSWPDKGYIKEYEDIIVVKLA